MQAVKLSDADLAAISKQSIEKLRALIENPKWEKFADKPCAMFKMEIGDRVASRGEALVHYPIQDVCEFLKKDTTLKILNDQLKDIKTIYDSGDIQVVHQHYKGIWPVSDRDFVAVNGSDESQADVKYLSAESCAYDFP